MFQHEQAQQRIQTNAFVNQTKLDQHAELARKTNPVTSVKGLGNQAMQQLLHSRIVQAKLQISEPGDQYEQEADRVAETVMKMTDESSIERTQNLSIQRKCSSCEDELQRYAMEKEDEEHSVQRKTVTGQQTVAAPGVEAQIRSITGGGQKLPAPTRAFFERRLQQDLSQVTIHADAEAAESARSINALAYTVGNHVVFGEGRYEPESASGRKLLAHELVHTVQQSEQQQIQRVVGDGHDLGSPRFSCDPDLEGSFDNERLLRSGSRGPAVKVVQQALVDDGFPLPRFGVDGEFGDETRSAVRDFQRSQGLVGPDVDGIVGPITMGLLDGEFAGSAPTPAPSCDHPGNQRQVTLQPVFFRDSVADPAPTGTSWAGRFFQSNVIWGKIGVSFSARSPVTLTNAVNKIAGANDAEANRIAALRTGAGIEVFLVDNDMAGSGGASTSPGGGAAGNIVMSDRGTSDTLLAHELGHILGLGHPPDADAGTIMVGSNSHSIANPTRNTMCNYARITFPARGAETCLLPDP
jgi:peptidoglycan hydrolase-like protein with peptidoglycan-binding domain